LASTEIEELKQSYARETALSHQEAQKRLQEFEPNKLKKDKGISAEALC
jgi:hypothetical protein